MNSGRRLRNSASGFKLHFGSCFRMSRHEISYLINHAIEHVLKEQAFLLARDDAGTTAPVSKLLGQLASELHLFRIGKHTPRNPDEAVLKFATNLEKAADDLSEEIWRWIPVNAISICQKIAEAEQAVRSDKTFSKRLRAHFDNL